MQTYKIGSLGISDRINIDANRIKSYVIDSAKTPDNNL